jgi:ubiquinone/menaquinone biosynthesis C-methylase UbiE
VSKFLGDLNGKRLLEIGSGTGLISVLLAKSGAHVTSFDLSPMSVRTTKQRAEINDVNIDPLVSAGEHLPFADESFEIIFGKSILHHLDPQVGKLDISRVLRKGGKAVFVEPMGMNPVLTFARKYVPYRHKNPVGVDRPLTYQDMDTWTEDFHDRNYRETQLLSMIERGFGWERKFNVLRKLDDILLQHVHFLRRFCRYVVISATK